MSERDLKPVDSGWQAQQVAAPYLGHDASKAGAPAYYFEDHQQQPSLRTHKSLPYSLAASNAGVIGQGSVSSAEGTRRRQSGKESRESTGHPQTSFGGSAPASPASRVSPRSPGQDDKDAPGDEEDLDFAMEEGEGEDDDGKPQSQMTAAEIRNQKRKMKRFRLTHSQTRFLMSEFARQAHPDAAHRERLSREIPGLSPRQVQVWFQNRRAKLKRLTTEDRERMMKSRQLPDDFDMSHTLHSGYGAGSSSGGVTPHASPANYPPAMQHPGGIRPLTLDTLRRGGAPEQSYVSPTGVSPALDSLAFTPPQSATDTASPISTASGMSAFGFSHRPLVDSPRRNLFPGNASNVPGFPPHLTHAPRMNMHDRLRRPSAETVSSPLRSSVSYNSMSTGSSQPHEQGGVASTHGGEGQSYAPIREARNMGPPMGPPYGLGIPFTPMTTFHTSVPPPPVQQPTTGPGNMAMIQAYPRDNQQQFFGQPLPNQPLPSYQQVFHGAGYNVAQMQQFPYSGPFGSQQYQGAYMPHQSADQPELASQPQQYAQLSGRVAGEGEESDADNSDGGVPIPPPY